MPATAGVLDENGRPLPRRFWRAGQSNAGGGYRRAGVKRPNLSRARIVCLSTSGWVRRRKR